GAAAPAADTPGPTEPLSVAALLRREGRRAPHAVAGPLAPRGHLPFPEPSLSAPRPQVSRRGTAVTGALVAAGAVLGATVLGESVHTPGRDPAPESGTAQADGPSGGSSLVVATPGGEGALGLAASAAGLVDVPPQATATTLGDLATGAASSAPGTPATPGVTAPAPATDGPGAGGPLPPAASGALPGGPAPDGGLPTVPPPGGAGPDGPALPGPGLPVPPVVDRPGDGSTTVTLPEVTTPPVTADLPVAPPVTVSPLAVRAPSVTLDTSGDGPPLDTGAGGVDTPDLRTGDAGPVGEAEVVLPDADLSDDGGLEVSAAEVRTPSLELGGTTVDLPDLATPELSTGGLLG
ncbi:MAG: hypothetical protein NTW05_28505, partial [Pseudonocardiales bacterium]|nr:hypothetical protein [Pseudonocardiales bacterium]